MVRQCGSTLELMKLTENKLSQYWRYNKKNGVRFSVLLFGSLAYILHVFTFSYMMLTRVSEFNQMEQKALNNLYVPTALNSL